MRRKLVIASGGSGDLVSAYALAQIEVRDHVEAYAAPIWERVALDPQPGPRGREQVANLVDDGCGWRVLADTSIPGGWSPQPRLVAQVGIRLYYLDVSLGACGVAEQLQQICESAALDLVELVDVGGDVLARGDEPGLVSPALDAVLLAACSLIAVPGVVTVVGEGLDGELSQSELALALHELPTPLTVYLPRSVARAVYAALSWFPSEASLMTLLAAAGFAGDADIRAGTHPVRLDRGAAAARTYPLEDVLHRSKLACAVRHSTSIAEVDSTLRALGCVSELGREQAQRDLAGEVGPDPPSIEAAPLLGSVHRQATHIGLRRLSSVLGLRTWQRADALDAQLANSFGPSYRKPLLPVGALRAFALDQATSARRRPPITGPAGRQVR